MAFSVVRFVLLLPNKSILLLLHQTVLRQCLVKAKEVTQSSGLNIISTQYVCHKTYGNCP